MAADHAAVLLIRTLRAESEISMICMQLHLALVATFERCLLSFRPLVGAVVARAEASCWLPRLLRKRSDTCCCWRFVEAARRLLER